MSVIFGCLHTFDREVCLIITSSKNVPGTVWAGTTANRLSTLLFNNDQTIGHYIYLSFYLSVFLWFFFLLWAEIVIITNSSHLDSHLLFSFYYPIFSFSGISFESIFLYLLNIALVLFSVFYLDPGRPWLRREEETDWNWSSAYRF